MQLHKCLSDAVLRTATENLLEFEFSFLVDGHKGAMRMRVRLVEVYDKSENILFPIFLGNELVHILCPFLNVLLPLQLGVVGIVSFFKLLVAESQFPHLVSGTTKDKIDNSPLRNLDFPNVWIINATGCKVILHSCRNTMLLVNHSDDTPTRHFKVQVFP